MVSHMNTTRMDATKPILLIDLSSFIFYRFFALQRWLTFSGKELSQSEMQAKFAELFEKNIKDIKKKLKVDWGNVILAQDCPRDKIWRNAIYAGYKGTRDAMRNAKFDPTVFTDAYTTIIPRMQKELGFHLISHEAAEADDVIAVISGHVKSQVTIMSTDTDFLQLSSPNTRIINFTFKDLDASMSEDKKNHYLLWKIIRGDSSDNIPSIEKKIGDATAMKLAKDDNMLKQKLASSDVARENFERNKVLISFEFIPQRIRDQIIDTFEKEKLIHKK